MLSLTMNLQSSAELLGTRPELFLEFAEREHIAGIMRFNGDWRISIFTLASLLNTTPVVLLDLFEDYQLGQLIEEVADDESFAMTEDKNRKLIHCEVTL